MGFNVHSLAVLPQLMSERRTRVRSFHAAPLKIELPSRQARFDPVKGGEMVREDRLSGKRL